MKKKAQAPKRKRLSHGVRKARKMLANAFLRSSLDSGEYQIDYGIPLNQERDNDVFDPSLPGTAGSRKQQKGILASKVKETNLAKPEPHVNYKKLNRHGMPKGCGKGESEKITTKKPRVQKIHTKPEYWVPTKGVRNEDGSYRKSGSVLIHRGSGSGLCVADYRVVGKGYIFKDHQGKRFWGILEELPLTHVVRSKIRAAIKDGKKEYRHAKLEAANDKVYEAKKAA